MPHVNNTSEKWKCGSNKKVGLKWTMNGLGKPLDKNPIQKNENSKNLSEIAAYEQKTTSEKAKFCSNTVFSLYFKIRAVKFHTAKPLAFCSTSWFGVPKITTPIWLQKSRKCVNRSLKKRQRPNTIQIMSAIIADWEAEAAINNCYHLRLRCYQITLNQWSSMNQFFQWISNIAGRLPE